MVSELKVADVTRHQLILTWVSVSASSSGLIYYGRGESNCIICCAGEAQTFKSSFGYIGMTSAFDDSPKGRGWKANLYVNMYGQVMISWETRAGSREMKVTMYSNNSYFFWGKKSNIELLYFMGTLLPRMLHTLHSANPYYFAKANEGTKHLLGITPVPSCKL